ncbi:Hsp70 family protein [Actinomadura kijaniata]|uniref:Hsp70 family protein n=1 Tax=Actinomadura kijaniata TaxID=46161 RepID=UPI000830C1BD|nr:Hsp70 family protein [Actinomadura kijaniata]
MTQTVSKAVGIDLGTTNSAVAVMDPTDTEIVIHRDRVSKSPTTPSCVWRDPVGGDLVVGRKAVLRVGNPPEPVRSVKRLMGGTATVDLSGRPMRPEEVSAAILAEMKRQIEEDVAGLATADTTWVVDRAMVTVPAYFDQPQIDATRRAAELAGLEVLDLLHEPTAAACYFCWQTKTRDGTFLVYDLGGGTFDVSVVRASAGVYEVLGISGNNRLGGDDIDTALARRLQEMLAHEGYALDLDPAGDPEDRLRFSQLKLLAEGVKKGLSQSSEYMLRDAGRLRDKLGNPVIIEAMFERTDLDEVARPLIDRTIPYCHEALDRARAKAGVSLADIDQVILAGGSTHMPLVRETVAERLCAGARCDEPLYDKVDTIVALGAAIRAAVVGGVQVYDGDRRVRVSFRGASATGATRTHIGGTVESLGGADLAGGRVLLNTPDGDQDEADIKASGAFAFTRVPLEPGAESHFSFEILDADDEHVATVGRPIRHSDDAERRLPGPANTAISTKAVLLEVERGGRAYRRELVPAMQELPTVAEFTFQHPGDTELVLFPLYQQSKQIQVIKVPVPGATPRGTPVRFSLSMDRHSFITVRGAIGETGFEAAVELPPERPVPTDAEIAELDRGLEEAAAFLPPGDRATFDIKRRMARKALAEALSIGDRDQAVHEFEQLEELLGQAGTPAEALEPPRGEFDQMVADCVELNTWLDRNSAQLDRPYDAREMARAIEAQRAQGEAAHRASDQRAWGEVIRQLQSYLDHMATVYRRAQPQSEGGDVQRAAASVGIGLREVAEVKRLASGAGRSDLYAEAAQIEGRFHDLGTRIEQDPRGVADSAAGLHHRLAQLKNLLTGRSTGPAGGGKRVEDTPGADEWRGR